MVVIHLIQEITHGFPVLTHGNDLLQVLHWHDFSASTFLAQNVRDPDVLGDIQKSFDNFIKSGQVWALAIGVIVGYMLRGITA